MEHALDTGPQILKYFFVRYRNHQKRDLFQEFQGELHFVHRIQGSRMCKF